jgi:signal peptidase
VDALKGLSFVLKDVLEIVVAVLVAWFFYQGLAIAVNTPMPLVSVVSHSMEPILHVGDLLFVIGTNDPKVGDIIIYDNPDVSMNIVHRIVQKMDNGFIIKGDNNFSPDPGIVTKEQIKGKVVFAIPLLGYPRMVLGLLGI